MVIHIDPLRERWLPDSPLTTPQMDMHVITHETSSRLRRNKVYCGDTIQSESWRDLIYIYLHVVIGPKARIKYQTKMTNFEMTRHDKSVLRQIRLYSARHLAAHLVIGLISEYCWRPSERRALLNIQTLSPWWDGIEKIRFGMVSLFLCFRLNFSHTSMSAACVKRKTFRFMFHCWKIFLWRTPQN